MKVIAGSLKGATAIKDAQGSCRNLSKLLNLGTRYRLFFPVTTDEHGANDILLAAVPGRKLDYEKLKRSFITLSDFEQSETGRIVDNSGLQPYARISRVLFEAECAMEKAKAKDEAIKIASQTGKEVDQVALAASLKEIELAYHGDRDAKPSAVYATKSPMISSVVVEVATEVYVVPLTSNGEPEFAKAFVAAFPISSRKQKQLVELVTNPDTCPIGTKFLEVSYNYTGTDKKQAGMDATLQGCSHETSLAVKYPELWAANKDGLDKLSTSAEAIASKNMSMSSTATTAEVVELFKKYVSKNSLTLVYIDLESDIAKSAAKDMVEFDIAVEAPTVQKKLIELVNSQTEDKEAEEELNAAEVTGAAKAKSLSELEAATDNVDKLTGGEGEIGIDEV